MFLIDLPESYCHQKRHVSPVVHENDKRIKEAFVFSSVYVSYETPKQHCIESKQGHNPGFKRRGCLNDFTSRIVSDA